MQDYDLTQTWIKLNGLDRDGKSRGVGLLQFVCHRYRLKTA